MPELRSPQALNFGPDLNSDGVEDIYIASYGTNDIRTYSGTDGSYIAAGRMGVGKSRLIRDLDIANVDGNDVVAVYEATVEAVKRAREGGGPTLVECKTYRHKGHFEGDPCVYMPEEEMQEWKAKDPIPRFEKELLDAGVLTQEKIVEIKDSINKDLSDAAKFADESPLPDLSELFDDVYAP